MREQSHNTLQLDLGHLDGPLTCESLNLFAILCDSKQTYKFVFTLGSFVCTGVR